MAAFKFQVSQRKGKKYDAVFADGRVVSFGGLRGDGKPYAQYKDRTSLKAYTAYDHLDKKRRSAYYARHGLINNDKPYTADWFSKTFLW